MFEWHAKGRRFYIREARGEAEYHAVEEIQREVWGFNDLDIVPAATLIATAWAGGMVLCAFEGDNIIGFAYGFPAHEHGRASIHSHMLAVRSEYRNAQVGFFLKLAQRERTLAMGLGEITWTFDPLQSLNAHLNFAKLGVISRRYIVNFYGEATSSPLHQGLGTDRLWVSWALESDRVKRRIEGSRSNSLPDPDILSYGTAARLVEAEGRQPHLADLNSGLSSNRCLLEIPDNINALKQAAPPAASRWREATRRAFLAAIEAGFVVEDFIRLEAEGRPRWFYLLSR